MYYIIKTSLKYRQRRMLMSSGQNIKSGKQLFIQVLYPISLGNITLKAFQSNMFQQSFIQVIFHIWIILFVKRWRHPLRLAYITLKDRAYFGVSKKCQDLNINEILIVLCRICKLTRNDFQKSENKDQNLETKNCYIQLIYIKFS